MIWILVLLGIYLAVGLTALRRGSAYRLAVVSSFVVIAVMRLTL